MTKRAVFSSKLGLTMTALGSAVGVGNIWRFPYIMGENGGSVFLMVYLLCVCLIGCPLMLAEFIIGRRAKANPVRAFQVLAPGTRWYLIGVLGVAACLLLLAFYAVIIGWILYYLEQSLTGHLYTLSSEQQVAAFHDFIANPFRILLFCSIAILCSFFIVLRGVSKGIERSTYFLLPLMFVLLVTMAVRACLLPRAIDGLNFMFRPDFSKLSTHTLLTAMGQAFFSLSIGLCVLITYSSYSKEDVNLSKTAGRVALLDTMVALLAGLVIFPAVFSFGIEPSTGTNLVFLALPNIFGQMEFPILWSSLFYLILYIAALTSYLSLHELLTGVLAETFQLKRWVSLSIVSIVLFILSIPCALSFSYLKEFTWGDKNLFSLLDYATSSLLMPTIGIFISWFVGWRLGKSVISDELSNHGQLTVHLISILSFLLRYITPIGIGCILVSSALEL